MKKILLFGSVTFFMGYISLFVVLAVNQESITYPVPPRPFSPCEAFYRADAVTHGETRMWHRNRKDTDILVVFYHGNGNVACDLGFLARDFDAAGVSYLFPEYAGYGGDGREPSHDGVLQNVRDVVAYIDLQDYDAVYVMGQSIGTGAASYHASLSAPDQLLLLSPFTRLADVAMQHFVIYPDFVIGRSIGDVFNNVHHLQEYSGQLVILHGADDFTIPVEQGQFLFDQVGGQHERSEIFVIAGHGHNGMFQSEKVREVIKDFLLAH